MSKRTRWQAKEKYNLKHYRKMGFQLPIQLVEDFKAQCNEMNISYSSVVKEGMERFLIECKK